MPPLPMQAGCPHHNQTSLITLNTTLELQLSKHLKKQIPASIYHNLFESHTDQPINLPARYKPLDEFLTHHRTKVFQK